MGLLLGNLLAVLSWMLLTAPIATRARLTLYFQLEKICGRQLVTLYNLANGVMFCFLAGAMMTVSATALGPIFNLPMPSLTDVYPNSWQLGDGEPWLSARAIAIVAAFGYQSVAKFANIAAPWMVLVFLAFGVVAAAAVSGRHGCRRSSRSATSGSWPSTVIWKGGDPLPGQTKFTFWHVMFFAWFCNMAMHIGMSDLSRLPLRAQVLLCQCVGGRHVHRALHGLDLRVHVVCVSAARNASRCITWCSCCGIIPLSMRP